MPENPYINTIIEDLMNQVGNPPSSLIGGQGATPNIDGALLTKEQANDYMNASLQDVFRKKESPLLPTMLKATDIDISGRFDKQAIGWDNEDLYGQAQSNWDKAANGLLKGLNLAGTTFVQGTLGLVYGLGKVVTGNGFNSLYNNELSNAIDTWNKKLENSLPNYYTARERNAEWWEPANVFTANFLFDKLVKNIGFSVGALYSGAAITKALKLVPELFGISLSQKAAQAANAVEEAANASNGVNRMGNVTNAVKSFGGKSLVALNDAKPFVQRALVSSLAAATEGGIESLQGINEYRNQQIEDYKSKYGFSPIGEDLAKINEYAENLGNSRFGLNMLLLTATNYVMLPKILGGSYRSSKSLANDLVQDSKGVFKSALPEKGLPKLLNRAKNISGLFFSRTEAFEELSQYATQKGVEDYYNKAFKGEGVNWLESISEGYKAALSDKEGMESLLIGGLSGGLQQAGFISTKGIGKTGKIRERGVTGYGGEREAATTKLLEALNGSKLKFKSDKWLADMAQAATRGINLQLEGEALVRQGDVLEAKDNEFDYLHNYLTPRIKHGRYDLVKDDITNYRQLAVTDFAVLQQNGIANENDTYETFTTRLNNFEAHANNVNSLYTSLNLRYGGVVDEENKRVYSDEVIDKMVYSASKITDYDQRTTQLNSELSSKGISAYPILDSIINNDSAPKDATEEALNQINVLSETSDVKDELKQQLQDVIELSFRKKAFLSQYDRIKKNPQSYREAPVEQITSPIASVSQEGGKKELEVGKTYPLSTPFLNDNGQLSFKPEISIVSKTLGGEYEVKLPNGKTAFLSPQDFKKYQIADTALPASAQLEAAINKAIGSVLSKNNIAAPATLQEKLSLINEANDLQLARDVEQAVNEETKELVKQLEKERKQREEFEKNKALQDKLAASQTATEQTSGDVGSPSPTKGRGEQDDDYARAPLYNFPSKESMFENGEMKLHQQLRNNFLIGYDNFSEEQRAKIRAITVTVDNEEFLGLKGFTEYALQGNKPLAGQIPIVKLYITAENSGKFLIGEDGEPLSTIPLGQPTDYSMAIFGMFHEADFGIYKFGPLEGKQSYSKGTEKELEELLPKHKAWRESILAQGKTNGFSEYEIQGISRGVPELEEEENSVIGTFVEEKDLSRQLVQIPTKENDIQVVAEGKSLNFPIGQPVFVNGNTIEPLNNRQFTEKEINNLYSLIHKLSENRKGEFSETIISFLKGMLYWKTLKTGTAGNNQIWIDRQGLLHLGAGTNTVQFTPEAITQNKDRVIEFLSQAYNNVNNLKLKDMQRKFYELQIQDDGTIAEIEHPNYQHFLLTGAKPFLTTNVRKISKDVPNDTNYRYKYSILKGKEFERPEPITKPTPPNIPVVGETQQATLTIAGTLFPINYIIEGEQIAILPNSFLDTLQTYLATTKNKNGNIIMDVLRSGDTETTNQEITVALAEDLIQKQLAKAEIQTEPVVENDRRALSISSIVQVPNSTDYVGYYIKPTATYQGKTIEAMVGNVADFRELEEIRQTSNARVVETLNEKYNREKPEAKIIVEKEVTEDTEAEDIIKKKIEERKQQAKAKPSDWKDSQFRVLSGLEDYNPANIEKELKYIAEKSGFDVAILTNILKTPEGIFAWGKYKNLVITLYDRMQEGTGYHELFHGVMDVFTNSKEKRTLYDEFRSRTGSFVDRATGQNLTYGAATYKQFEDHVADEFADFALNGNKLPKAKTSLIERFFRNIWNFIKSILSGDVQSIDQLFARIDKGKYKSAAYKSIPGMVDVYSKDYRIGNLDATKTSQVVRGVVTEIFDKFFQDKKSLVEFDENPNASIAELYKHVYSRLEEFYTLAIYNDEIFPEIANNDSLLIAYNDVWTNISNNWEDVKRLGEEYLKLYGIVRDEEYEDDDREANDDTSRNEYTTDHFKVSGMKTASKSIKLLIGTISEAAFDKKQSASLSSSPNDKDVVSERLPETGMQDLVSFTKTFNQLLSSLHSLNTLDEKLQKLDELRAKFPNYQKLWKRLNSSSDNLLYDWKLKTKFHSVFSKQKPEAIIMYMQTDGSSYSGKANLKDSISITIQGWLDNLKQQALNGETQLVTIDEKGNFFLIPDKQFKMDISSIRGKIAFLSLLEIPFTEAEFETLPKSQRKKFSDAVVGLSDLINKSNRHNIESSKTLKSVANLTAIAESKIIAGDDFDSTFSNIDNEPVQTFILPNDVSKNVNNFNNSQTIEDLIKRMPQLQATYARDSIYINDILFKDGKRTIAPLIVKYIQGIVDLKRNTATQNLSTPSRLLQEINQNLNDTYYILLPADSNTEGMLEMSTPISFAELRDNNGLSWNRIYSIFEDYLLTESEMFNHDGKHRLLSELSNKYTATQEEFRTNLKNHVNSLSDELFNTLSFYNVISKNKDGTFKFSGIDKGFTTANGLDFEKLSENNVKNILKFRNINTIINNIEIQKLFFGDVAEYIKPTDTYESRFKEHFRRIKSFLSPRESSTYGNPKFNEFLNEGNKAGNIQLEPTDPGYHTNSDIISTIPMADIISTNEILAKEDKKYGGNNTSDSQAWAPLPTYKELIIKSGFRWTDKHEYIYQYRMSQDRILMSRDKVYKYTNQKLREHDEKIVAEYEFPYVYFPVIKPIVSGHTDTNGEYHPILDKDSVVPLSYSFVRGTNMQEHYVKMLKQDIGYLIAESGRKVGNKGTDSFYNEDGSVNTVPYKNIVNVRFEDFGIQQETSGKKNTQTRVSQLTKLAILNLYDGGIPTSPEVKALVEENKFLLEEQTNNGYNGLLKKLGIIDDDSQFIINDKSKTLKLLKDELLRREVTNNIKESLELNEEGEFLTAFEALPNYRQIKSILFSFVNKFIAKPRIAGGPKVQVSGALMEKHGIKRSIINGKVAYTSDSLQFYTEGKPQMEVLIPFHFAKQLRDTGFKWEDEKELMAIISRSPDKNKILSGIGARIPTQELNSVESFIIKGFLPEEMGDTIVVPEELTTKAGSDFDVDKLNTYLRNLVINKKTKEIRVASLFDVNTADDEKLKDFYEEFLLEPYKQFKITKEEKGVVISLGDLFETISSEEDDKLISDELERQSIPSIEEYMIESKGMDKYEFNRKYNPNYRKAIENAYYDNLQAILALPQNFKRLIKPNHSDELIEYKDRMVKVAPGEFDTKQIKSIINPLYVSKLRHTFIIGKGGVGIAAQGQTGNAVAQLSDVYIDPSRIQLLKDSNESKYIGDGLIALPHNQNANGFATISKMLDKAGRYISDKISQYINGFVDIAKDPFIVQIGANKALASTFLLLERLGVPSDVVVYFMNQPIIREYAKIVDRGQTNFFYDEKKITEARSRFKSGNKPKPTSFTEKGLAEHLLGNIEKYYTKKSMNEQDNAEQQFILDEFLKYYTIAQSLFRLTQGTNYDTQKFSSDYSLVFKELQYQDAQDNTIFNSAKNILQSSFIGNVRNKLLSATKALNTLSNLKDVKFTLNSVIKDFKRNYEAKETVGPLIEESYITYLIQAKLRLSNQIEPLVLNTKTALVNDLRRIKNEAVSHLKNNILLKQMLPMIDARNAAKNIRVAIKPKTVFQKELYTEAFQELLDHPLTEQFARNVARLNFLQAGISGNVLSMKDYMPIKLYSDTVNVALSHSTPEIAQEFKNVDAFYRNSWSNTALVPILSDGDFDEQTGDWEYKYNHSIPGITGPLFAVHAKKREANMGKFLTLVRTDEQENKYKFLLKRVEDANGPIIISNFMFINGKRVRIDKYIYTPVNAWGNGFRLQEYYDTIQPSKTANGYRKIQQEIDHNDVIAQLQRLGNLPTESTETTFDDFKNTLPKEGC